MLNRPWLLPALMLALAIPVGCSDVPSDSPSPAPSGTPSPSSPPGETPTPTQGGETPTATQASETPTPTATQAGETPTPTATQAGETPTATQAGETPTPTPIGQTPTPIGQTPTPIGQTPTPIGQTPTPTASGQTPTPIGQTPTPIGQTPTSAPTPTQASGTPTATPAATPTATAAPTPTATTPTSLLDNDGDGYSPADGDCNDGDPSIFPGADELCDGIDNNCDGVVDTDAIDRGSYHADVDGDGYGEAAETLACATGPGVVLDGTDCDDGAADTYPGADEICDGRDNDCDTIRDEGVTQTFYPDGDGDGVGTSEGAQQACAASDGFVSTAGDCNDGDPAVFPGASEACNEGDDDCDGQSDEGVQSTFYGDSDGDGYGVPGVTTVACAAPDGYVANATDCDDGDGAVYPGAEEICNDINDDCDFSTDEGVRPTWYLDEDNDEFGGDKTFVSCSAPAGYVPDGGDCDDDEPNTYPGADELCEGDDNDCDGVAIPSAPLQVSASGSSCSGGTLTLEASDVDGASYSWSGPNGFTSAAQSPELSGLDGDDEGTYTVTASVAGCALEETYTVALTTVDASFTSPGTGYLGAPVTFTANEGGATYDWTFASGSPGSATDQSPMVTWAEEGTYEVSLTTTADGCSATTTQSIDIIDTTAGCARILARSPSAPSGVYTIDPDQEGPIAPFDVYCEMDIDGGGWTLELNINTTDGTISTLNMPVWTDTEEYGVFADRFATDYKSLAAETLEGTELLLVVREASAAEGATPVGWRSWYLDGSKKMNDFFSVSMGSETANTSGGCNGGWSGDGRRQTDGIKSIGQSALFDPFTTAGEDVYTNSYYGGCGTNQDGFRMSNWYRWANNSNVGLGLQMDSNSQGIYSLEAGAHLQIETFPNPQRFCSGACGSCTAYPAGDQSVSQQTLVAIGTDHYDYHCTVGVSYRFEWYVK